LDFAKSKGDSAKKAVRDTVASLKNKLVSDAKNELMSKLSGKKDSTGTKKDVDVNEIKNNAVDAGKSIFNNLFKKKQKDTSSHH
jgi:hypothetical protein